MISQEDIDAFSDDSKGMEYINEKETDDQDNTKQKSTLKDYLAESIISVKASIRLS